MILAVADEEHTALHAGAMGTIEHAGQRIAVSAGTAFSGTEHGVDQAGAERDPAHHVIFGVDDVEAVVRG